MAGVHATSLSASDLKTYENAAAGHEGVLSNADGTLLVKPCHAAELAFYEASNASHPAFAAFLPTYYGSLALPSPSERVAIEQAAQDPTNLSAALQADLSTPHPPDTAQPSNPAPPPASAADTDAANDPALRKFGKALPSATAIVLENLTAGFARPCILDVKLGAQLWDASAPEPKRRRLDAVAAQTTSASLGMRVAGMRVWAGADAAATAIAAAAAADPPHVEVHGGYAVYNKLFGRALTPQTAGAALRTFFTASPAGRDPAVARMLLAVCEADLARVQAVMEAQESRMFSASVLLVYEGDEAAMAAAIEAAEGEGRRHGGGGDGHEDGDGGAQEDADEDDDDESDEQPSKVYTVRLIDFAHAAWTPGEGPDENSLQGIRSLRRLLAELVAEADQA